MAMSTEMVGRLLASGRNYASTIVGFIGGMGVISASQSKSLTDEIRNRVKESAAVLTRELKELRSEKTDRAALAGLFTEAAMRLSGDMKPSGKE